MSYVDRPDPRGFAAQLDRARRSTATFDPDEAHTEAHGWTLDHYEADLPPEPPGPPVPGGSFETARRILHDYDFPDPRLITGIYSPDDPLEGRPMVLRARFLMFTFWLGVRVSGVIDQVTTTEDGPVHEWGYGYTTLEGHFERGHITFRVRKAARTGAVSVHIDAVSKPDHIRNPFYRAGFKLFGRRLQVRFARTSLERIERFVRQELAQAPPPERDTVSVERPDAEARRELERHDPTRSPSDA